MIYLEKPNPKVLGNDIMAPLDRAVEIFKKVVENAPYGKHAEDAQLKLGEALKKSERYEEAVQAYHKIVDDYPNSKFATKAMYEEAYCAYKASLKPAYDSNATNNAIKTFEKFVDKNKDTSLSQEAVKTMKRLKDNVSEKSFEAAQFYEARGKTESGIIYYQDVIDTYPDSPFAAKAKIRIEELKNKGNKKALAPIDFNKKKPKPVTRKTKTKKLWNPLNFMSKKPDSGKKTSTTTDQNTPKESSWKPISFFSAWKKETKKSPEAPAVEIPIAQIKKEEPPAAPTAEAPKPEPATQAMETTKPEPTAQVLEAPTPLPAPQAVESPAVKPETETIEAPKKEEAVLKAQETPKQKFWKPLRFETKKEPIVKEAPKNKAWKPLNFDAKKEPVVKEIREKKPWKPLRFDAKISEEAGVWKPLNFGKK
jgi:outer membrane assembly lipoprotein YfiO